MFLTIATWLKPSSVSPSRPFCLFCLYFCFPTQSIPQIPPSVIVLKYKSDHFTFQHQTYQWLPFFNRLTSRLNPKLFTIDPPPIIIFLSLPQHSYWPFSCLEVFAFSVLSACHTFSLSFIHLVSA